MIISLFFFFFIADKIFKILFLLVHMPININGKELILHEMNLGFYLCEIVKIEFKFYYYLNSKSEIECKIFGV